jgi:hypothetical protein
MNWLNLQTYTPVELTLVGIGCAMWIVVYAIVVFHMFRKRYVEIAAAAVAANVAWEFVWGFLNTPDLGMLFTWMYRAGFLLDCIIVAALWMYGSKQISTPALRQIFRPALLFGIAAWLVATELFVRQGLDNAYGGVSGYIINVQLSALYIVLFAKEPLTKYFSYLVAWSKLIGTAFISLFNVLAASQNHFLMWLCALTFVLDVVYVVMFARRRRRESADAG